MQREQGGREGELTVHLEHASVHRLEVLVRRLRLVPALTSQHMQNTLSSHPPTLLYLELCSDALSSFPLSVGLPQAFAHSTCNTGGGTHSKEILKRSRTCSQQEQRMVILVQQAQLFFRPVLVATNSAERETRTEEASVSE